MDIDDLLLEMAEADRRPRQPFKEFDPWAVPSITRGPYVRTKEMRQELRRKQKKWWRERHAQPPAKRQCFVCKKEFETYTVRLSRTFYCTTRCRNMAHYRRKRMEQRLEHLPNSGRSLGGNLLDSEADTAAGA